MEMLEYYVSFSSLMTHQFFVKTEIYVEFPPVFLPKICSLFQGLEANSSLNML